MERLKNNAWLIENKINFKDIVSLLGDASTRKYFRLVDKNKKKFIAVTYEETEVGRKSFQRFIFWQKTYP